LESFFNFDVFFTFFIALTLGLGGTLLVYVISRMITPFKKFKMKRERFECANPPSGKARGWFMMQYYCYLIIFLTIEPIMIFFFLFLLAERALLINSAVLFIGILLLLIPPLIFGLDAAKKLDMWKSD
jgi:NADH-quinone oxidoreductase subunit A